MRRTVRRALATCALGLALALAPVPAFAGPRKSAQGDSAPRMRVAAAVERLLGGGWQWVASLWEKVGSAIDPNGGAMAPVGEPEGGTNTGQNG